jgi:glycosyltransferase involved in cell wall biosynthesis
LYRISVRAGHEVKSSVDVVVPCYNYGRFLRQCVRSILEQSHRDVRVLIIDDASPDDTEQVGRALAAEDSRVTYWKHEANKGHIATYNEGIAWAQSTYFLLLSADDYLLPGALERAVGLLDHNSDVGFVCGASIEIFDDQAAPRPSVELAPFPEWLAGRAAATMSGSEFVERSGCSCHVVTATAVLRTDLQKRVGGYKPELPHAGDMEMWLRLSLHGSVGVIGSPQAVRRNHGKNMSIDYFSRSHVEDLKQRRIVLQCYINDRKTLGIDDLALNNFLLSRLAGSMALAAGSAYNNGDQGTARELADMALRTHSTVRWTSAWFRLMVKRMFGARGWKRLYDSEFGRFVARRANRCNQPSRLGR